MNCGKRVVEISRYSYKDDQFPKVIKDKVFLGGPGLCRGSIIICLDGRRHETTRKCGVYLCKRVKGEKDPEDLYYYEAVKIGIIDAENIDFGYKFWYVKEFVKLNKRIKCRFKEHSFWYRFFHRPLLVPELFCDLKNLSDYK